MNIFYLCIFFILNIKYLYKFYLKYSNSYFKNLYINNLNVNKQNNSLQIKILSWNISYLPKFMNTFYNNRIFDIISFMKLTDPNIIVLQEVFSNYSREVLIEYFKNNNYNYVLSPNTILMNGGLVIACKYHIIDYDYYTYKNYYGEDSLSNKGILYILVKINDTYYNIFNTHLNNDTPLICFSNNILLKKKQIDEFILYTKNIIKKTESIYKNINNIFSGDFNIIYNSNNYIYLVKNLNNIKIYTNKNEIITDNIKNVQVDYIMNTYNNNKLNNEIYISIDSLTHLSDHNPFIKLINI